MAGFASLIVQHFVKAVESSSVRLKPFPHLVVDEILPGDIFRSVFDELPSLSDLARAPNAGVFGVAAYDRRATLPVEELSSPGGPSIWDDVGSGLKSNESERGVHLLLQVRTQVLNEDLQTTFHRWYPGMQIRSGESEQRKAA
jgi:hypothetical protein